MNFNKLAKLYPDKSVIITGAGSGLGLALTELLLSDGWKVAAIDINARALQTLDCPNLSVYIQDVTLLSEFESLIKNILKKSEVDILFNNAGVGEGTAFQDYSVQNWDWIININLKSLIAATHFLLPYFRSKNSGMVVNIASAAGYANLPNMSPYNITKAAVISLSESLAHEFSKTGIVIKCVTPTFFKSAIMQHSKGTPSVINSATKIIEGSKLSSKDAAKIILENLHKKNEVIRFPFSAHFLYYSKALFPSLFKVVVRKLLVK